MMIKINVVVDNVNWLKVIKNPKIYISRKTIKLNRRNKIFKEKIFYCTLLLSGSKKIKELNKKFRKKNKITDILSFPFHSKKNLTTEIKKTKKIYLGDIIINLNRIKEKNSLKIFKHHFNKLWVHGLVHLFGYNHEKEKNFYAMQRVEKNFINYIE
jgi:probable rRNA maturation factor